MIIPTISWMRSTRCTDERGEMREGRESDVGVAGGKLGFRISPIAVMDSAVDMISTAVGVLYRSGER